MISSPPEETPRSSRHGSDMGYHVVVVRDCCASNDEENHLPTIATVAGLDEVLAALA